MNILQAIDSGKSFKRKGSKTWNGNHPEYTYDFTYQDLLATDWEIEERKIEITESEFDAAISGVSQKHDSSLYSILHDLKYRLFSK